VPIDPAQPVGFTLKATDAAGNARTLVVPSDTTAPSMSATDRFGPDGAYIGTDVTVRDALSGLARVEALTLANARPAAPFTLPRTFSPPTTGTVAFRMVPVDPAQPVGFTLRATDAAGNTRTVDPVVVQLERARGKPVATTVELAPGERWVDVQNDDPGLTHLRLTVNGQHFQVSGLKDGETRTLDIGAALRPSGNTATLEARGKPGGRASVVLHDCAGAPRPASRGRAARARPARGPVRRYRDPARSGSHPGPARPPASSTGGLPAVTRPATRPREVHPGARARRGGRRPPAARTRPTPIRAGEVTRWREDERGAGGWRG
jgi:hypothetical protein